MRIPKFDAVARLVVFAAVLGGSPVSTSAKSINDLHVWVRNCSEIQVSLTAFNAWDVSRSDPTDTATIDPQVTDSAGCVSFGTVGGGYNSCWIEVNCAGGTTCAQQVHELNPVAHTYRFVNGASVIERGEVCPAQ